MTSRPLQPRPQTFETFATAPGNRAAWVAVRELAERFVLGQTVPETLLVFLHGPTGTGKSHLLAALVDDLGRRVLDQEIVLLTAQEFSARAQVRTLEDEEENAGHDRDFLLSCDLLMIEDLQYLTKSGPESLAGILDHRQVRGLPTVLTALTGPNALGNRSGKYPARLINRLTCGLVIGLQSLPQSSRRSLLDQMVRTQELKVESDALDWLADRLQGGARQLEGALQRLEFLARLKPSPLAKTEVMESFRELAEVNRLTVESIARRVGGFFQVDPRQLSSPKRNTRVLRPRQVTMYLARQLTGLSLHQIGSFFGGRDHSTVLHACRRVEEDLDHDPLLAGAVRQLRAELT